VTTARNDPKSEPGNSVLHGRQFRSGNFCWQVVLCSLEMKEKWELSRFGTGLALYQADEIKQSSGSQGRSC
jgi:hypothetical protein